jgi:superfamily II DNA helicase RecQ
MMQFGLKTVVINSNTYTAAQRDGRDLWKEVCEGVMIILLSPEELASHGCFMLLEDPKFTQRVSVLGVDEVHLIYWWGKHLHPSFHQIGNLCSRLPLRNGQQLPVVATTATLRVGEPMVCIQEVLGLVPGQY